MIVHVAAKYEVGHPNYAFSISQRDVADEFATRQWDEFADEEVLNTDIIVDQSDRSE